MIGYGYAFFLLTIAVVCLCTISCPRPKSAAKILICCGVPNIIPAWSHSHEPAVVALPESFFPNPLLALSHVFAALYEGLTALVAAH